MNIRTISATCIVALMPLSLMAQGNNTSFNQYKAQRQQEFNNYKEKRRKKVEEYRRKRNEEFANYLRSRWEAINPKPITPKPKDETIPPVVVPKDMEVALETPTSKPFLVLNSVFAAAGIFKYTSECPSDISEEEIFKA